MSLKPINIIQAAEADLRRRARNVDRYARGDNSIEQYAFLGQHVRRAENVRHLLTLARNCKSLRTIKRNTLLIYGDTDLLNRAIAQSGGDDNGRGTPAEGA